VANQEDTGSFVSRVEMRHLFPTPIITALIQEASAINAELREKILAREAQDPGQQHSNLGGWQSAPDFQAWSGQAGGRLLRAAVELANRHTVNRQGQPVRVEWNIGCWANVNRRSHGNEFHTHPGAFWSGVYYVEDGGTGRSQDLGGEFEIQDPRGVAPVMYAPLLTIAGPAGPSMGASELLRPRSGMMVLFPSWLQHGVRPYLGDSLRISVAFNLNLKPA